MIPNILIFLKFFIKTDSEIRSGWARDTLLPISVPAIVSIMVNKKCLREALKNCYKTWLSLNDVLFFWPKFGCKFPHFKNPIFHFLISLLTQTVLSDVIISPPSVATLVFEIWEGFSCQRMWLFLSSLKKMYLNHFIEIGHTNTKRCSDFGKPSDSSSKMKPRIAISRAFYFL